MKQVGYVVQVDEEVKIRVARESACGGNCGACHGCPSGAVFITCLNNKEHPFEIGEQVVIEMSSANFLKGTFGSYGVMTICMLLGAILGYAVTKNEITSVLGGVLGLILGAVWMRLMFGKHSQNLTIQRQNEERKQ